jgi:tRNA-specific 2-thiouridylase
MSGGVDSSTSAALMKERGFEVIGCTFKMFDSPKSAAAIAGAKRTADFLKADHEVIDCVDDFKKSVKDYFSESYKNGITPNPCVICNRFIKFKYLNEFRLRRDAEILVTGHYVQIKKSGDRVELFRAEDLQKDQSYFLYGVDREILKFAEFPLGGHPSKSYTRDLARKFGLPSAEESESQDVCFLPNNDYMSFLRQNSSEISAEGDIVDESGRILGKHSGTSRYTIGQRKGLGLSGGPFFVRETDALRNIVIVSDKNGLKVDKIFLKNVKFLNEEYLGECEVKIRSAGPKKSAKIMKTSAGYHAELLQPEYGVAPGQHCVFYDGHRVLGGGEIDRAAA